MRRGLLLPLLLASLLELPRPRPPECRPEPEPIDPPARRPPPASVPPAAGYSTSPLGFVRPSDPRAGAVIPYTAEGRAAVAAAEEKRTRRRARRLGQS